MHWKITALWGGKKVELRETPRAVTPFGGLVVFFEFLRQVGYREAVNRCICRFVSLPPTRIDPVQTFTAFLLSVVAGSAAIRAHQFAACRRGLAARCWGWRAFPATTPCATCSSALARGSASVFSPACGAWQLARLPECSAGYSLDLDSTVFERYGQQQGALRGPNPRKHGRPSHHPLVAVLAEAHFLLHGWLRSGNCGTARGVVEFLKEALALLPEKHALRVVRADAGFFDQQLLGFLEQRGLCYIVVARLTRWLKREAARVTAVARAGRALRRGRILLATVRLGPPAPLRGDPRTTARRAPLAGKKTAGCSRLHLSPVSSPTFPLPPEEIWRDYNRRADMENRIAELKHDLAADDFCLQEFFATEAAFRSILLLFNLLGEFQRACRLTTVSPTRHAARPGFPLRRSAGPSRPPLGPASVRFLGRPAATHPAAGKHLNST